MKKFISLLIAVVMILSLASCGGKAETANSAKVIKVGVFQPQSGQNAAGGKKEILGIEYAHSLKPSVKIGGETYEVQLVYADNGSDASKAPTAAQTLISQGVSIVVGTYGSGCAIAAGDLFADAKIPAIGTSCTNPQVTEGNDYYFRVCYIDPFQGQVMASYALGRGCKNCAVIVEAGDDYSAGFGNYFTKAFTGGNGKCQTIEFVTGTTDFSTIVAKLKASGVDGIFAPVSIETAPLIINQAREAGIKCPIMAGDTWDDISIAERAASNATDVYFSCFFDETDTTNKAGVEFVNGFLKWVAADSSRIENNGGNANNVSSVVPCGYDAYMTAVAALEKAGTTDGAKVRDALASLEVKGLVTGDIKFDSNGDAIKNYVAIKTIKDGAIVFSTAYQG